MVDKINSTVKLHANSPRLPKSTGQKHAAGKFQGDSATEKLNAVNKVNNQNNSHDSANKEQQIVKELQNLNFQLNQKDESTKDSSPAQLAGNNNPSVVNDKPDNNKELFAQNMLNRLKQVEVSNEGLSNAELKLVQSQIQSCWYGQGGYSNDDNVPIKLILTMNPDGSVADINIPDEDLYTTEVRQKLLQQVLRAFKDPKCRQLALPAHSYSSWRQLHVTFSQIN